MITVRFLPDEKTVSVPAGTAWLQAAAAAGIPVEGNCGSRGTCGKCRVQVVSGPAGEPTAAELKYLTARELEEGWRLACQHGAETEVSLRVRPPEEASARKQALAAGARRVKPDPAVQKTAVKLARPTVHDQVPDCERLLEALGSPRLEVSREVLADLPRRLRDSAFTATAVTAGRRLLAVEPGDTSGELYGLACDIGTTTVVASLADLTRGKVLATEADTNPQNIFGADVISRINYASRPERAAELQERVAGALNGIIERLIGRTGVPRSRIYEAVAVGNTTMSHLFLGVDPTFLAPAPFIPAYGGPVEAAASELGLNIHPRGRVLVLPNIAGYVGSDTVGVILATRLDRRRGVCLAVDIGTNGELVLAGRGRILCCSTAAGPAFEGAQISCGMRAAAGAVEKVAPGPEVRLEVIGGVPPRGICGSGLIDLAARLLQWGAMDGRGRLAGPEEAGDGLPAAVRERLRQGEGGREFVLVRGAGPAAGEDMVITQRDLRELQLAKGAMFAGARLLMQEMGVTEADLDAVLLAGAFGSYVSRESALAIGLLPPVPPEKVIPVGNAAGQGALLALVSRRERARALALAGRVEHIELSTRPDFQQHFMEAMAYPQIKGATGQPNPHR